MLDIWLCFGFCKLFSHLLNVFAEVIEAEMSSLLLKLISDARAD